MTALDSTLNQLDDFSSFKSTWFERLFMNLLSYFIVLVPVAFIVIASRLGLFPRAIASHTLVLWFVHGSMDNRKSRTNVHSNDDQQSLLPIPFKTKKDPSDDSRQNTVKQGGYVEFTLCLVGLQFSYLIWGILQEKIMTTNYVVTKQSHLSYTTSGVVGDSDRRKIIPTIAFHDSQFLVFVNRIAAFIVAILALVYTRHREANLHSERFKNLASSSAGHAEIDDKTVRKPACPLYKYIYCSLTNVLSSWCQYEALKYISFPTQCLSKSCKVIPVMLMSKLLMKKRYSSIDYICAILLALGMFVFMVYQPVNIRHHQRSKFEINGSTHLNVEQDQTREFGFILEVAQSSLFMSGLAILGLYLIFDSFTSNWQQSLYNQYDISNWQMMASISFYSILLTLTSLHQLGSLLPSFKILTSSTDLMRDCLTMSAMSSIGQMFVYYTIKRFGSVIFAVIMTLRQILSILLSCAIYKHRLTLGSVIGMLTVFAVVGFQVWYKSITNRAARKKVQFGDPLLIGTFTKFYPRLGPDSTVAQRTFIKMDNK